MNMGVKSPDQVDVEVGQRIRVLRNDAGISQTVLAEELGVTFQQVQKYEKGVNRVGAGGACQ
jgi:transcriptional regulator with XRE-family HTH domain